VKRNKPLRPKTQLRRRSWLRVRGSTKYRRRERDMDYMGWARRQPCVVRALDPFAFAVTAKELGIPLRATCCSGHVEADHMGARGLGQKADDRTCVPMCSNHHRERTDHTGTFRPLKRDELRAWRAAAIEHTQAAWAVWSNR
jgi:hypothetical protein